MGLPIPSLAGLVSLLALATLTYTLARIIYNLYFHPLAKYPGPLLHRATRVAFLIDLVRGRLARKVLPMHRRYGPIVRIAPDELSFAAPEAWKDIYGHRTGLNAGVDELPKSPMWYRNKDVPPSILGEDRDNHALLRRQLAHGFSDKSMREQEGIIGGYVDLLVKRLGEHAIDWEATDKVTGLHGVQRPLDMTMWYNWTTFDIIGDLAFGEPFGSLDRADYDPFVKALGDTLVAHRWVHVIKFMGWQDLLMPVFNWFAKGRAEYGVRSRRMLERRMQVERSDLIQGLLSKKDSWNMHPNQIHMNASILLIAGSETTATQLSGVTFMLLQHPQWLKRVTDEVRSSFASDKDITLLSVSKLECMLACLNEALRHYPPISFGMPRSVPKGGVLIIGEHIPEDTTVAVWQWSLYHNEAYFADPFEYHPERFLQHPRYANDRLDALQPFSVGPRNCIGRNLAYAEMRLILARILFNFDIRFADEAKSSNWLDQIVYVLWKKPPLEVYLTPVSR